MLLALIAVTAILPTPAQAETGWSENSADPTRLRIELSSWANSVGVTVTFDGQIHPWQMATVQSSSTNISPDTQCQAAIQNPFGTNCTPMQVATALAQHYLGNNYPVGPTDFATVYDFQRSLTQPWVDSNEDFSVDASYQTLMYDLVTLAFKAFLDLLVGKGMDEIGTSGSLGVTPEQYQAAQPCLEAFFGGDRILPLLFAIEQVDFQPYVDLMSLNIGAIPGHLANAMNLLLTDFQFQLSDALGLSTDTCIASAVGAKAIAGLLSGLAEDLIKKAAIVGVVLALAPEIVQLVWDYLTKFIGHGAFVAGFQFHTAEATYLSNAVDALRNATSIHVIGGSTEGGINFWMDSVNLTGSFALNGHLYGIIVLNTDEYVSSDEPGLAALLSSQGMDPSLAAGLGRQWVKLPLTFINRNRETFTPIGYANCEAFHGTLARVSSGLITITNQPRLVGLDGTPAIEIDDRGDLPGTAPEQLYFDRQSGLLVGDVESAGGRQPGSYPVDCGVDEPDSGLTFPAADYNQPFAVSAPAHYVDLSRT
jgi:hypothetical protein